MKIDNTEIKELLGKIEDHKKVIAKARDELREIYADLEYVIDSFDSGIEGLELGKSEIEGAIDSLSEHV